MKKANFGFTVDYVKKSNDSDDVSVIFAGYASTFFNVDNQKDIVLPGAFRKSVQKYKSIKLLWQHDVAEPIGYITNLKEDRHGLYIEGRIMLSISRGRELIQLMKKDIINALSIGFKIEKSYINKSTRLRYIEDADLVEVSFVTFPANPKAFARIVTESEKRFLQTIDATTSKLQNY